MPTEKQISAIKEAMDYPDALDQWEHERINEWADYPEHRPLTQKQDAILKRILEKIDKQALHL